ncbi:MAG: hypothetical protein C4550_07005 [Nitrospiraceae bacterium]|nr:MAG: hypothetical protein C4550_07005 [Nitrospiraceae bacterium]
MKSKLMLPVGLAAIIITALVTGWLAFSGHSKNETTCTLNVPEKIASLPRTEFISGPEAIQQIAMMHGKNISLDEGHIAKYKSGGTEVTIWISVSPSREEGEELFRLMDEKMPASKVFKNRQEVEIRSRKVVKVDGMGQEHYYWVSGKYNYWVAVAGTDGKTIVDDLMLKVE